MGININHRKYGEGRDVFPWNRVQGNGIRKERNLTYLSRPPTLLFGLIVVKYKRTPSKSLYSLRIDNTIAPMIIMAHCNTSVKITAVKPPTGKKAFSREVRTIS